MSWVALAVTSAATIAIPYSFKRIIDRGFTAGSGEAVAGAFHYMLMIVVVLIDITKINHADLLGKFLNDLLRQARTNRMRWRHMPHRAR